MSGRCTQCRYRKNVMVPDSTAELCVCVFHLVLSVKFNTTSYIVLLHVFYVNELIKKYWWWHRLNNDAWLKIKNTGEKFNKQTNSQRDQAQFCCDQTLVVFSHYFQAFLSFLSPTGLKWCNTLICLCFLFSVDIYQYRQLLWSNKVKSLMMLIPVSSPMLWDNQHESLTCQRFNVSHVLL